MFFRRARFSYCFCFASRCVCQKEDFFFPDAAEERAGIVAAAVDEAILTGIHRRMLIRTIQSIYIYPLLENFNSWAGVNLENSVDVKKGIPLNHPLMTRRIRSYRRHSGHHPDLPGRAPA